MYLYMKVGPYEGQVRGPFHVDVARQLIATDQAVQAEFRDGKFQAPLLPEEETPAKAAKNGKKAKS